MKSLKSDIIKLNKESRNYFKFAPGSQATKWEEFYKGSIIAINFNLTDDLNKFKSREELSISIGLPDDGMSNKTFNLWLFKTANIGDVVFATKGVNTCLVIGVITGNYTFEDVWDDFNHRRKTKWITNKVYQYKADTLKDYKTLFRPDTFSPTKVYDFILKEYTILNIITIIFYRYKIVDYQPFKIRQTCVLMKKLSFSHFFIGFVKYF